jgi:hypothetical protein
VVERGDGEIARRVACVDADRRFQVLVVREREERDMDCRIALDADGGAGKSGVDAIADAHARLDVRRRRAIDDELGAAEIDVVER